MTPSQCIKIFYIWTLWLCIIIKTPISNWFAFWLLLQNAILCLANMFDVTKPIAIHKVVLDESIENHTCIQGPRMTHLGIQYHPVLAAAHLSTPLAYVNNLEILEPLLLMLKSTVSSFPFLRERWSLGTPLNPLGGLWIYLQRYKINSN